MCCPGGKRTEEQGDDRLRRNRAEQHPQAWRILIRCRDLQQLAQRHQQKAKADDGAADIACARLAAAAAKHHDADQDENRRG
jgi:hypothetical protein